MTASDEKSSNAAPEVPPASDNKTSLEDISKKYDELISSIKTEPIPPGLSADSEKYREFRKQESDIVGATRELLLTPEIADRIWEFKTQIDSLLVNLDKAAVENGHGVEKQHETEMDESTDPKTIERLARDVRLISDVEQLDLLEPEAGDDAYTYKRKLDRKREIQKIIERRNWGDVFSKLNEGDQVVTVLVPGVDFLKIKNLNDNVFGYSRTTDILEERKRLIEKHLVEDGGFGTSILKTDYQSSTLKIPADKKPEEYLKKLSEEFKKIDDAMTVFIENIVRDELERYKSDAAKTEILQKFQAELSGRPADGHTGRAGYRLTFGVATVEGDAMAERLDALNRSTQTARTARGIEGSYGMEYNEDVIDSELDRIKALREELKNESITNSNGVKFELFSKIKDGKKEYQVLNTDVLRDVRKGKFKSDAASKDVLMKVNEYVKKINLIDSVKPFIKEEAVEGGRLQKQIRDHVELTDNLLNGESSEVEKKKIAEIIKTEEKDSNYTSLDQFNSEAIKIKKCAYLSIDVIDVGVDQLLEFERLLQEAENEGGGDKDARRKKLDEKAETAGDGMTKKMRIIREKIKDVLEGYGLMNEGKVLGDVRGDEVTLALDIGDLEKKNLTVEQVMFEIKEATNHGMADVRIVKTVAAEATRDSSGIDKESQTELFKDHLVTIKRAEKGAEIAKKIEEEARALNLRIQKDGSKKVEGAISAAGLDKIFKIDNKGAVKSFVIVMEKEDGFDVKSEGQTIDSEELQKMIEIAEYKRAT